MPLSNHDSTPTDGNTAQWDKVKAMRDAQAARDRGESTGTPVQVIGLESPAAAEPAAPPPAEPPAAVEPPPAGDPPRDPATGKFVKASDAAPAAEGTTPEPKKDAPAPAVPPAATTREVTIDGVKVSVTPELADAFEKAEEQLKSVKSASERETLKAELREELKKELAPPAKSDAEIAAERALAEAERLKNAPQKPDVKLLITDPAEYEKQRDAYEEWRVEEKLRKAEEKRDTDNRATQRQQAQLTEQQARDTLKVQFYDAYPVLKDSADLVDVILTEQFDALAASGRLSPQNLAKMTAADKENLKKAEFAAAAAKATKRLVKLAHGSKTTIAPPPPPPPNLAASQPAKTAVKAPPAAPPEQPKTKYPKGSISAVLAERKAKLEGRAA